MKQKNVGLYWRGLVPLFATIFWALYLQPKRIFTAIGAKEKVLGTFSPDKSDSLLKLNTVFCVFATATEELVAKTTKKVFSKKAKAVSWISFKKKN
ncbi:MAG: hypothetical protein HC787_09545 [Nostocaceae cyanobacterium CSU_2_110]|nr:hypothetical protein [Nostocaceae cyanobacterium CSU_2_110]